ncbi:MAG: hypothetical protein JNJ46_17770 [Myxococcales bacterium]|nr:hypothetical protein [Myxococcales bacterium]
MNTKSGSLFRMMFLWLYLFCFAFCIVLILALYHKNRIQAGSGTTNDPNNLKSGLFQVYSSYSTYIAILTAFYYNSRKISSNPEQEQQVGTAFWIALFSSVLWNALNVLSLVRCWYGGTIEAALDMIGYWGTLFSFLPALFIGLYIANPVTNKP